MLSANKKNIDLNFLSVARVPSMAVTVSFKCDDNSWLLLSKLKKGYKTMDEQYSKGGQCLILCYSMFQKILSKSKDHFDSAKTPISCLNCSVYNKHFNISFMTSNTLTSLKRCIKFILKNLDPKSVWKWYSVNIKNMGNKADKSEFIWAVNEINKNLKDKLAVFASGKCKAEKKNITAIVDYWAESFSGKKVEKGAKKPETASYKIPEAKSHTTVKTDNKLGCVSMLVASYINTTLGINSTVDGSNVIVWRDNIEKKLASIKNKTRIERELLAKKNINLMIAFGMNESGIVDTTDIAKFVKADPTKSAVVSSVYNSL